MRQIVLRKFGIENLTMETAKRPVPHQDEVLVRMHAAALNYVDLAIVEATEAPVRAGRGWSRSCGRNWS
jgi:NADPH:quinone reductase-like Zn-dependent oxidoreductase